MTDDEPFFPAGTVLVDLGRAGTDPGSQRRGILDGTKVENAASRRHG